MIIAYLARWFIPSSPATTARIVSIFQARRDALLYAHGEGGGGGWLEILSFRRSIAFQIARRGSWLNSMGGLNGIPLEHREGPRRSVKGCISSATTLFVAGQSDYAEKFRYATILRGLYARVEIPFALNWIRSPLSQAADNFFFFSSFLLFWIWINTSCLEKVLRSRAFIWELFQRCLFGCCEFVRVLKKNKLDISLIFKLEAWKCSFFFKLR